MQPTLVRARLSCETLAEAKRSALEAQRRREDSPGRDSASDCWDGVSPDDSASARGNTERLDKAKVREQELVALRRLVQSDDRFGHALEKGTHAMHELIAMGNSGPVLALLASLVWRSLCIAWELDSGPATSKAKLRTTVTAMEQDYGKMQKDLDQCRASHLRELVALRDRLRRLDSEMLCEVSMLVYEEEPVMYYEPLRFLEDNMRLHVAEIVEEKMKLLLFRLKKKKRDDFICTLASPEEAEARAELAEADAAKTKHALEALIESSAHSRERCRELERAMQQLKMECGTAEGELAGLMISARREWEDLNYFSRTRGGGHESMLPQPPPEIPRCYSASGREMRRSGSVTPRSSGSVTPLATPAGSRPGSASRGGRPGESGGSIEVNGSGGIARSMGGVHGFVGELLRAGESARRSLVAELEDAKAQLDYLRRTVEASALSCESAAEEQIAAQKARDEARRSADAERARVSAIEAELQEQRRELAEEKAWSSRNQSKYNALLAKHEEARKEIERLKAELANRVQNAREPPAVKHPVDWKPPEWDKLNWKLPTGKVFDRLFNDAMAREERRRLLDDSIRVAFEDKVLDIFHSGDFCPPGAALTVPLHAELRPVEDGRRPSSATVARIPHVQVAQGMITHQGPERSGRSTGRRAVPTSPATAAAASRASSGSPKPRSRERPEEEALLSAAAGASSGSPKPCSRERPEGEALLSATAAASKERLEGEALLSAAAAASRERPEGEALLAAAAAALGEVSQAEGRSGTRSPSFQPMIIQACAGTEGDSMPRPRAPLRRLPSPAPEAQTPEEQEAEDGSGSSASSAVLAAPLAAALELTGRPCSQQPPARKLQLPLTILEALAPERQVPPAMPAAKARVRPRSAQKLPLESRSRPRSASAVGAAPLLHPLPRQRPPLSHPDLVRETQRLLARPPPGYPSSSTMARAVSQPTLRSSQSRRPGA